MHGLLNYSETTQDPVTENKHGHKRQKRKYFLICESCFWCASALSLRPIGNEQFLNVLCVMMTIASV